MIGLDQKDLLTSCGIIKKANVFFLPNTSPAIVKKIVPIKPPKYNDESIHLISFRERGGTSNGESKLLNFSTYEANQATDIPNVIFSKFANNIKLTKAIQVNFLFRF